MAKLNLDLISGPPAFEFPTQTPRPLHSSPQHLKSTGMVDAFPKEILGGGTEGSTFTYVCLSGTQAGVCTPARRRGHLL